jgi:hypothetical protein
MSSRRVVRRIEGSFTRLSPACTLNDRDLPLPQPVQLIHQRVYLPVGGLDLPLVEFLAGRGSDGKRIARFRLAFKADDMPSWGQ